MDPLSSLLDHLRFVGWFFCQSELAAPWGLELPGGRLAALHGVIEGHCVIDTGDASGTVTLGAGDIAFLPLDKPHRVRSDITADSLRVDQVTGLDRSDRNLTRLTISGGGARTRLLSASFITQDGFQSLAFRGLPAIIPLRGEEGEFPSSIAATVAAIDREGAAGSPGAGPVLRRLAEILFVQTLRAVIEDDSASGTWLGALSHSGLRRALASIHDDPGAAWSLNSLAALAGMSRSSFAHAFRADVGVTPLAYVTGLRMSLATRALKETEAPLATIAADQGYASVPAFTKVFRKVIGSTPGSIRRALHPNRRSDGG